MAENAIQVLRERGLLDNVTDEGIEKMVEKPLTVYAGFDPTSDSLQLGNLVAIMGLANFQRCGHKVIALVGGATGMIGDPSGKSAERNLLTEEQVQMNLEGIKADLARVLDFEHETAPAKMVNNNDWMKEFTFVEFLRDVGKHFRIGTMLAKESVRARLDSDEGMSFAEFSYQLLQGYDFLHLFDNEQCTIQVGGSDQWGNITAGMDLVHKLRAEQVYGVTFPLICDSSGKKFGKSEGNAVFLNPDKTSSYDLYQFFIRTADSDVGKFLKLFTFMSVEEIAELKKQTESEPEKRTAQKRLAEEVTRMLHGQKGVDIAQKASDVLFGGSLEGLSADDLMSIFADVPSQELASGDVIGANVLDVAAASGMCKSKGEARRLVTGGGFNLNNNRVSDIAAAVQEGDVIDGRVIVLRSGKKNFFLVKVL